MGTRGARFVRCLVGQCGIVLLALHGSPATAGVIEDVKALFEAGNARAALALAKQNPQYLGNPQFDYFLGLAAIDSGEPGEGVLALERYLLNTPDSNAARLELGRGYFLLGDNTRARDMFEEVKLRNPPAVVRERADEYLAAIRQRESIYTTAVTGFVELGGGHDSNVNSGTASGIINIPLFGNVTIDPSGREQADRFAYLAASGQVTRPVAPGWSVFGGVSVDARGNRDFSQYDQRNLSATFGTVRQRGDQQWRMSLAGNQLDVDSERYRTLAAGTLEWQKKVSEARSFTLFAQGADIRYAGDNAVRNARLYSAGGSCRAAFAARWQPLLSVGVNAGKERNTQDRDDLGRTLAGASASLALTFSPRWGAALSTSYQRSRYGAEDAFFAARRVDNYASVEAAIGRAISASLGVRLEVQHIDNRSSIALFQYARTQVALKFRYDMK